MLFYILNTIYYKFNLAGFEVPECQFPQPIARGHELSIGAESDLTGITRVCVSFERLFLELAHFVGAGISHYRIVHRLSTEVLAGGMECDSRQTTTNHIGTQQLYTDQRQQKMNE